MRETPKRSPKPALSVLPRIPRSRKEGLTGRRCPRRRCSLLVATMMKTGQALRPKRVALLPGQARCVLFPVLIPASNNSPVPALRTAQGRRKGALRGRRPALPDSLVAVSRAPDLPLPRGPALALAVALLPRRHRRLQTANRDARSVRKAGVRLISPIRGPRAVMRISAGASLHRVAASRESSAMSRPWAAHSL